MDELHRRLIRIGLDALADDYGYALGGGYAVQAHHIVNRVSDDVDLFAPHTRGTAELPDALDRIVTAYEAAGYTVEPPHRTDSYARFMVTDPATGHQSKVELVAEFLHHPPVPSDLGPVLHPDDVAAGKTGALFGRAEVRDAIDVDGLLKAGYTRERLMELAAQNEGGLTIDTFADALGRIRHYTDKQFAAYDLDREAAAAIRAQFADWRQQLITAASTAEASHTPAAEAASRSLPAKPGPRTPKSPAQPASGSTERHRGRR